MNPRQSADNQLVDPDLVDDLSLDFIEQEVGRIRFDQNWPAMRGKYERLSKWLRDRKVSNAYLPSILRNIQSRWDRHEQFDNPYTREKVSVKKGGK